MTDETNIIPFPEGGRKGPDFAPDRHKHARREYIHHVKKLRDYRVAMGVEHDPNEPHQVQSELAALAMRACDLMAMSRRAAPVERVKLFGRSKEILETYIALRDELNKENDDE